MPPVLIKAVNPIFPSRNPQDKRVTVGLLVDRAGLPQQIHIVASAGRDFDDAAMDAIKQYRFKPATQDGQPVVVELNIIVNFKVR